MTVVHKHHRKLRSQGGDDSDANILELDPFVHHEVHAKPALAYEHGLLVHSWDDPAEILVDMKGFLAALGRTPVGTGSEGSEEPHRHEQGVEKDCPKCHGSGKVVIKERSERKERAESSPIYNARTPVGESREVLEEDEDQLTDVLVKAGVLRGHSGARWWVIHYAYRFALQNAREFVKEFSGEGS